MNALVVSIWLWVSCGGERGVGTLLKSSEFGCLGGATYFKIEAAFPHPRELKLFSSMEKLACYRDELSFSWCLPVTPRNTKCYFCTSPKCSS